MNDITLCPECGVPLELDQIYTWLDDGVVALTYNPSNRCRFLETANLNYLFHDIQQTVGKPIEHLIIDTKRAASFHNITRLLPEGLKEKLKSGQVKLDELISFLAFRTVLAGVGILRLIDVRLEWNEKDYLVAHLSNPSCLPLICGEIAGGVEAIAETGEFIVAYHEISPHVYEIKISMSKDPEISLWGEGTVYHFDHSSETVEGLEGEDYHHREGGIQLTRCETCDAPSGLSAYRWDLDRGIIVNKTTDQRMSLGEKVLHEAFERLKEELGETVLGAVVEAQRGFTRTGALNIGDFTDENNLRTQLALRGLGNLEEMNIGVKGLYLRLYNSNLHLIAAGMLQGLFEMAYDKDSDVEWNLSEEGKLEVEVTPKTTKVMVNP